MKLAFFVKLALFVVVKLANLIPVGFFVTRNLTAGSFTSDNLETLCQRYILDLKHYSLYGSLVVAQSTLYSNDVIRA